MFRWDAPEVIAENLCLPFIRWVMAKKIGPNMIYLGKILYFNYKDSDESISKYSHYVQIQYERVENFANFKFTTTLQEMGSWR